ncbi:hypothetical protein HJC10_25585 [Corallococcus exiguus]|uniref:hypothetical protein n=1 Tax=Corallococcus TaxID=83461 RepID=UPI000ED8AAD3|nr:MULTISPECIES: hypothetical protein [Corallococcus]NNB89569.1 hypothetical protein [Corallococcus exiguus]NNB96868.1 hypothetical protein [Corallococcus exiguus]NNC06209.1 hypothetical protein [Corallococcus exiguus]NPC49824.1 hypothetical protein [Corallococcus exiguus]RKH77809.1 hypothetical protein D7X99_30330 [Corallococcus sp. AB032C]
MRFWIAIVAGLSMGQAYDPEPLPPEDPSVRDPAAAALQDAYEQANEDRNGARPPQDYVIQAPSDPTEGSYYSLTPLMSDGNPPVTSGDVAVQQSQRYVPPPVPTVFAQQPAPGEQTETEATQPQTGTGGAGAAGSSTEQPATGSGTAGTTTTTGGTTAGQPATGAGAAGTAPASGPTEANAPGFGGGYDTGATPLDTSGATVQEPTTATGGSGTAGTTGTETATQPPATGGAGAAGTPETGSAAQPATGGAGTAGTGTATPSGTTAPAQTPQDAAAANEEVTRLRQRIADLEQEMEARDTRATERTQAVQTQVDTHEQRAYEAERARQQRLARIQSGGQWMLAADQALEQGEMNVDNALDIADEDFSAVRQSAAAFGQGGVVVQAERIRAQIAYARDAANRRDSYAARIALQSAGDDLRLARAASLERSGTSNSLLNP